MVRITQNTMIRNYLTNMNMNMNRLAKSQDRMLGQKYRNASENLGDTSRALRVRQELHENEEYLVGVRDAAGRLSSAESNLRSINDILVTASEQLMLRANNDPNGEEREIMAQEIEALRDQVLQFANAEFSDIYLFSGTNNGEAPFKVDDDGDLTYNGIKVSDISAERKTITYDGVTYENVYTYTDPADGQEKPVPEDNNSYFDVGLGITVTGNQVESKSAFKITFSGLDCFGSGEDAEGIPNNVYNILDEAAQVLRAEPFDRERLEQLQDKLTLKTEDLMINVTDIGTRDNMLSTIEERVENDNYNLTALQQKLEVADTATESMNWKMYSAIMMATYQFGSQVLPQTLMDFIR